MVPLYTSICEEMIKNTEFLDKLTYEYFDVAIGELYGYCTVAIFHRIRAQTKLAAFAFLPAQLIAHRFSIPAFASFMPNMIAPSTNPLESSFFARLLNFYNEFYDWIRFDQIYLNNQEPLIHESFGPNFPPMISIVKNFSLVFFNSNPFFEFARPTSNKLIHIGGLVDQRKQKKQNLDGKFKQILDNAKHGAVLFSFGTVADTRQMNERMRNAIVKAFSAFAQIEFLWKVDKETIENNSALFATAKNVYAFNWIPQSAILEHQNLLAFITHCGQNSVNEAARNGKPIIGIPLFGDQLYNSMLARQKRMSIHLDVRELSGENAENVLISSIKNILYDPKYRQNAELIKKKLELMPFKASENLIRWVEFAAEFPELNELNLPFDDDMHWTVYYSLDAIGFTFCALFGILFLIWKCTKMIILYGLVKRRKKQTKKKNLERRFKAQ